MRAHLLLAAVSRHQSQVRTWGRTRVGSMTSRATYFRRALLELATQFDQFASRDLALVLPRRQFRRAHIEVALQERSMTSLKVVKITQCKQLIYIMYST